MIDLTVEQVKQIHEIIEKHWHDLSDEYDMPEATALPEYSYDWQAIADELNTELGSERDEIYNAGFDNGVKACLQILDGYLDYPHSAVENISKWVDEQWKEYES